MIGIARSAQHHHMVQALYTIAANTLVETIRQPIYSVILLATTLLLVLNAAITGFTVTVGDGDDQLLLDVGLSTLLLSGLFLSVFSAAGVLSREIENKTVLTVISKPIGRPVFFLGKYLGLAGAMALAYYLLFLVFVLAQRHGVMSNSSDPWDAPVLLFGFGSVFLAILGGAFANYFQGRHFAATAIGLAAPLLTLAVLSTTKLNKTFQVVEFGSEFLPFQIFVAGYLVFLIFLIISAVALAASARFGQMVTLIVTAVVMSLGIISDTAFGQHAESSLAAGALYSLVPNVGPFWIIDGLMAGTDQTAAPFIYVLAVTGYAALMTIAALCAGIAMFQRREVG